LADGNDPKENRPKSDASGNTHIGSEASFLNELHHLPAQELTEFWRDINYYFAQGLVGQDKAPRYEQQNAPPILDGTDLIGEKQGSKFIDPLVLPIYEAFQGKDSRITWSQDELKDADKILQDAGIKNPTPKQKEAVLQAERILDRPGFGKQGIMDQETSQFVHPANFAEAILKKAGIEAPSPEQINALLTVPEILGQREPKREIIDQKTEKHVDLVKLWREEIRGNNFGGPGSDQHAVAMYKVAKAFDDNRDWALGKSYYSNGIPVTQKAHSNRLETDSMLADQYDGIGKCIQLLGPAGDDKKSIIKFWNEAADYARAAQKIYREIYRREPNPDKMAYELHDKISSAYSIYYMLVQNDYVSAKHSKNKSEIDIEFGNVVMRRPLSSRRDGK